MAKKKSEVNKSQLIRDYFSANPEAKNKDVVEALKKTGVSVHPNMVSLVKTKAAKKNGQAKPGRKPKSEFDKLSPAARRLVTPIGQKITAARGLLAVCSKEEALELVEALG